MRRVLTACLLVTALTSAAFAEELGQGLPTLVRGDRVRVRLGGKTKTGTIEALTTEGLLLRSSRHAETTLMPLESIQKLEVARGQRSHWEEGALIGFVPGALLLGGLAGQLACMDAQWEPCNGTGAAVEGALIGGAATAGVGALVGLAIKTDRWVVVEQRKPQLGLTVMPSRGGFGAGVSLRF